MKGRAVKDHGATSHFQWHKPLAGVTRYDCNKPRFRTSEHAAIAAATLFRLTACGAHVTGTPRGTITGSTTGNGILGTMTLAPESGYAGDLDMIGKLFGEDAETLAGVVGSENVTSISSGDTFIADGTFSLTNQTPP